MKKWLLCLLWCMHMACALDTIDFYHWRDYIYQEQFNPHILVKHPDGTVESLESVAKRYGTVEDQHIVEAAKKRGSFIFS